MPGVRREGIATRPTLDRLGPPEGGFDVHIARVVANGCRVATHDARQRLDGRGICNDADRGVQVDRVAVEQLELLARPRPAHHKLVIDLVEIEDVRRPSELEHHVIGDVHQRRHAALPATRQSLHHPGRCLRLGVDATHDAAAETAA